jgi:hypothetical protein
MLRIHRVVFNALLDLAFALSASLSAAQGAGMTMPMAKMAGMVMADHQDRGDCSGSTDRNDMRSLACA